MAQMNHFRRYVAENPGKARLRGEFLLGIGADAGLIADAVLEQFGLDQNEEKQSRTLVRRGRGAGLEWRAD